ncbi:5664_t:CDS:2 [Entrophospora sp. SA101]|nr:5664_t:CDS:2 [Entrophospora sp. SA101]
MVRIKLLQLRAEFGQISKKIDENTYTFTLTSVDFEFLRLHFPHLVELLIFENLGPPNQIKNTKYLSDKIKCFSKGMGVLNMHQNIM